MTQTKQDVTTSLTGKWKSYPAYKDSGVEWLGEIPEHWEVKKIKRLCLVKRGASPRPIDDPIYFDDEGQYAWVRISDVSASNKYLLMTEQRLSLLGQSKSVCLKPGELFLSIAGTVGKPIITQIPCCIHDGFVYFINLKENREYLFYVFSGGELYKGLGKLGTQLNLNTDTIGDIRIPTPPETEQHSIATFLDRETAKINALIAKKERLIELLQEKRVALISHAVTKGLDPTVSMKDSGVEWLGEIPAHWEVFQLRRLVRRFVDYRGFTPAKTSQGVPLITARNVKNGVIDFASSQEFISEEDYASRMVRGFPEVGDVLITTEAPLGETAQIADEKVTLAQRIILLKIDKLQMINDYLKFYFISSSGQGGLWSQATGSTAIGIKASHLREVLVIVPSLLEQQAIAAYLDYETAKIDAFISRIREGIEKLKEYSTALISAAVTGKIDVRGEITPSYGTGFPESGRQ